MEPANDRQLLPLKERLVAVRAELFESDRQTPQKVPRPAFSKNDHASLIQRLSRGFVGILAIVLMGIFLLIFNDYLTTLVQMESLPGVVNLAKNPHNATLFFGPSPMCGIEECYISPDYEAKGGKQVQLPTARLSDMPEFQSAVASNRMYYRIPLEIPQALLDSGEVLAFSPGWVNHEHFEIYVNGRLIYEGQGRNSKETLVVIPLPKAFYEKNSVLVAVKAFVAAKDSGINHRGGLYLGPKSEVGRITTAHDRVTVTYFMLNLFSKGSVFVVFALIFLYTRATPGFFYFLIYAIAVTAENLIVNPEIPLPKHIQIPLYFQIKTLATYALFLYFAQHYRIIKSQKNKAIIGFGAHIVMLGLTIAFNINKTIISLPLIIGTSNFLLTLVLLFATIVGFQYITFLREKNVDSNLIKTNIYLTSAVSLYLALIVFESFFVKYSGMDRRYIFDLFFFFYFALANARATGLNEGRIVTLEAHYVEKQRMEQELQEAALISKLLLPTQPPTWEFCEMAVFHKPTSESSGDWFAFESSPDGRLYHMILCDITGHGVQAAIVVATCKTVLSNMTLNQPDLLCREDFVQLFGQRLGETLFRHGDGMHTATFLGMTFIPSEHRLNYVLGGHPCPYMMVQGSKEENLSTEPTIKPLLARSSPLGFTSSLNLSMKSSEIASGSEVLIYTDGIPLASNIKPMKRFLTQDQSDLSMKPQSLYHYIWKEHESKTGSGPDDDVSIIWVRMRA